MIDRMSNGAIEHLGNICKLSGIRYCDFLASPQLRLHHKAINVEGLLLASKAGKAFMACTKSAPDRRVKCPYALKNRASCSQHLQFPAPSSIVNLFDNDKVTSCDQFLPFLPA